MDEKTFIRFMRKVQVIPGGCWLWTAQVNRVGYGRFRMPNPRRTEQVSRVSYEHFVGPIPAGLDMDHKCHNEAAHAGLCAGGPCIHRRCVNPEHLAPATRSENLGNSPIKGGANKAKMECKRGHPLSGDNVYIAKGGRHCRKCKYARRKQWRTDNLDKWREQDARQHRNARQAKAGGRAIIANRAKTHCPKGHSYEGENLYILPSGARKCRTCLREANLRAYRKRKGMIESSDLTS